MYSQVDLMLPAFFVFYIAKCSTVSTLLQPKILPNKTEDILNANTNYSAFCQGQKPLVWKTPQIDDENYKQWTTFKTKVDAPTSTHYTFGIRLYITNITYKFVGFYYCHYEENENDKAAIYLYVEDKQHLSLYERDCLQHVYVRMNDTAIIPCRPTSPTVNVQLLEYDNDLVGETDTRSGQIEYWYNPYRGVITNATTEEKRALLICNFKRNGTRIQNFYNFIVEPISTYIHQPEIVDNNSGHTVLGDTINLTCGISSKLSVDFTWDIPNKHIDKQRIENISKHIAGNYHYSTLNISRATSADAGIYTCHVFDHQNHTNVSQLVVKIFDYGEGVISLERRSCPEYQTTYAGRDYVFCTVNAWGHPTPTYKWIIESKSVILPDTTNTSEKYKLLVNEHENTTTLIIRNITISDFGSYKLVASNDYYNKTLMFFLNVIDKPYVSVEIDKPFHRPEELGKVYCTATGYPMPVIQWEFQNCSKKGCPFEKIQGSLIYSQIMKSKSVITVSSNHLVSIVRCTATNLNGTDEGSLPFVISEFDEGFDITEFEETVILDKGSSVATFAVGENIRFLCGASKYEYTNLSLFFGDIELENNGRCNISYIITDFSHKAYLEIKKARPEYAGTYKCRVKPVNSTENFRYKEITVFVKVPVKPSLSDPKPEVIDTNSPEDIKMACKVYGIPKPKITWYKNENVIKAGETRVIIDEANQILRFNFTRQDDAGVYKCMAKNKIGVVFKQWSLRFKNTQKTLVWPFVVITILVIVFIIAVALMIIKIQKERKLRKILEGIGLAEFENGAIENINPDLGLDEQAQLLPYDKTYEFPIEKLKLGKQLGSGAFGVVMKGEAKQIIKGKPVSVVAVKMLKRNADRTHIKALASEIKIMMHLGKHLNVVNLLGACTKNITNEGLLVIVEYCRYGNLLDYLLRHRSHFVNQVDPSTGKVDYNIGQEILNRKYSVSSKSIAHSSSLKYPALLSNSDNNSRQPVPNNMSDYRAIDCKNEMFKSNSSVSNQVSEDSLILSNNSAQPEWRSNYTGDYKDNEKLISTEDLISWSFQVARGMEYLSHRKVLHGDLAARNILLADDNVVKICDFGLAKSMYRNEVYVKRGNCPLPIKWMAVESVRDHVFSVQSDVWSFGIVLWEFFTLGRTPYSGIDAESLYKKLLDGYRMDSPEFAPVDIYQIMTECWAANPLSRPSFTKLSDCIGVILEESTRKHYVHLNDSYLKMNTKRFDEGQCDYLNVLSPPTFGALSGPLCADDIVLQQSSDEECMSMKPISIFSPKGANDTMFDFNIHNRQHLNLDVVSEHTLLPMLHAPTESDSETHLWSSNGVANLSYFHIPTTLLEDNSNHLKNNAGSDDNSVNVPQNKTMMKDKCAGTPTKIEPAYMNSYSGNYDRFAVRN